MILCRIGLHTSTFQDGCRCHSARRCNRCSAWLNAHEGVLVDNCRWLVSAGRHPEQGRCSLRDADA